MEKQTQIMFELTKKAKDLES